MRSRSWGAFADFSGSKSAVRPAQARYLENKPKRHSGWAFRGFLATGFGEGVRGGGANRARWRAGWACACAHEPLLQIKRKAKAELAGASAADPERIYIYETLMSGDFFNRGDPVGAGTYNLHTAVDANGRRFKLLGSKPPASLSAVKN